MLGGIKIGVAPGTRVSVSGFALLGGREVQVSQRGDGPQIKMSLWAFLGGIRVAEIAAPQSTLARD